MPQIVFIDSRVQDHETLLENLSSDSKVFVIDENSNGLEQMAAVMQNLSDISAVHVFSHGSSGSLQLGNSIITESGLDAHQSALTTIGSALSENGDILLYGCNVAQGDEGMAFIRKISELTGADIAASDDLTGNAALSGDWIPEKNAGIIESSFYEIHSYKSTFYNYIYGDEKDNYLIGGSGADWLIGGLGADTMAGGDGTDYYDVDNPGDVIIELPLEGNDGVFITKSISYTLSPNIERLEINADNAYITANSLDNQIYSYKTNCTVNGGTGNDSYFIKNTGNVIVETSDIATEIDIVYSYTPSFTLSANIENLTLYASAISGTGNALDNTIIGNGLSNILYGLEGNDKIYGGSNAYSSSQSDTICGGAGKDTMSPGQNTVFIFNAASESPAGPERDIIECFSYTSKIDITNIDANTSNSGIHDSFTFVKGNSFTAPGQIRYNIYNDGSLYGILAGNTDTDLSTSEFEIEFRPHNYDLDSNYFTASVTNAATISSDASCTLAPNEQDLILTGTATINGTGNALNNTITGNDEANIISGMAGFDIITGGAGNDIFRFNKGDNEPAKSERYYYNGNLYYGNTMDYIVDFTPGEDRIDLSGIDANTSNTGIHDSFTFISGTSFTAPGQIRLYNNYKIQGNTDNDLSNFEFEIIINQTGQWIPLDASDFILTDSSATDISSSTSYTLAEDEKNLILTGTAAINGTGNALDNSITGNTAANVINGMAGADTMTGGTGNDTYYVDNAGDVVTETSTLSPEIDTVITSISYTLGANLEKLALTGTAAINGTGNTLNNSITGNTAANVINGMTGADTMTGGTGNDIYYVDNAGDVVTETSTVTTEIDTVFSTITYTLGSNLESLTLSGTAAINGTGNTLANNIMGNSAANVLTGLAGNDTINGGSGNDTIDGGAGRDSMTGGAGNDIFIFSAVSESISGTNHDIISDFVAGTDRIDLSAIDANTSTSSVKDAFSLITGTSFTAAGQLRFAGGILYGNTDSNLTTSEFEIALTGVTAMSASDFILTATSSTVNSSVSYTLKTGEQNLILTGTAAINGTGNTLNNSITGNTAANVINGMTGADTMTGGTGNDIYYVDNAGDVVTETSTVTTEIDTVFSTITYTLGSNLESLTLSGTAAINGTGNTLANIITGNSAANILTGNAGNDTLNGNAGADTINGGDGNDIIYGGTGKDSLTGGAGNDTFRFVSAGESLSGTNRDVITDFVSGADKINLSSIDANASTTGTNEAFTFITGSAFTAAGQVRFTSGIIYGNTDANFATVEFEIALTGITIINTLDFVL